MTSSRELEGRIAIVTGASSGIGRATALRFVEAGARVTIFARTEEALRAVERLAPDRIEAVCGDVGSPAAVDKLFDRTEARFGVCDLLVNNAGMVDPKPLAETSLNGWDRMFAVNTRSVFLTARRAIPAMTEKGGGTIVNVASISGVLGPSKGPGFVSYCASKAAMISMTESMASELLLHNIRVNCVSPGSVDTPMLRQANASWTPDMTPEEVAETILFLASDRSRPMNGQNLHVYSA